jgi:thiol-disulfide isomerase/thioredoxin
MSCNLDKSNTSGLTIKLNHDDIELVEIIRPIDGMILWDNKKDSLKINKKSFFHYQFNIATPEIIRLKIGEEWLKMIVQPNHSYQIKVIDSILTFESNNAKGNQLLNELHGAFNNSLDDLYKYDNDSTAILVKQKINVSKKKQMQQLDSLYAQNLIDKEFHNIFKNEIDYHYAEKIVNIVLSKSYSGKLINEDLDSFLKETIENHPVTSEIIPSNWTEYAEFAIIERNQYLQKKDGLITRDSLIKLSINGGIKKYKESLIINNLDGDYKEKLLAYYIIFSLKQENHEKYLIKFFENFKSSYPKSNYIKYLEPGINKVIEYHKKIKKDLPKTVKLIENESINSLEELLVQFQGQKIYVDLWATWCGPCKEEFQYNKNIDIILKNHNYIKLFISIDDSENKKKWLEQIKFYELNGFHFLANRSFQIDFANKFTLRKGSFAIPQYLIIDKKGAVINNDAPRPSESDELNKLLKTLK